MEYMVLRSIVTALFLCAAVIIVTSDHRLGKIPNWAVSIMLAAAVLSFVYSDAFDIALRCIVAGAMLLLIVAWKQGKIGAGDVKMLFACALAMNVLCFCLSLTFAAVSAAIFAAIRKTKKIRYGVFYAPCAILVLLISIHIL